MPTLPVHVFKSSFVPFMTLLNEHNLRYEIDKQRTGVILDGPGVLEIALSPNVVVALSTVIIGYLKSRPTRKVTITVGSTVVQAEGHSATQIEQLLADARSIVVIETADDGESD